MTRTAIPQPQQAAFGWEEGVLSSLYGVAFASPDREVAGVLVGRMLESEAMPRIQAVVPAAAGVDVGQASQFNHQSWAYIHDIMARHYNGLEVVGWYLSRPGMGTGLLDADRVNHQRWFSAPGQLLLAMDSRSHRGALYQQHATGLVQLHEGPVEHRDTARDHEGKPVGAIALLAFIGVALGALLFVLVQVLNAL